MSREAYEQGNWQAVIEAHPPGSHDPAEWLRYAVALLQTLKPGPEGSRLQRQAALAFRQAQTEGAEPAEVMAAQRQAIRLLLAEGLLLSGMQQEALELLASSLPGQMDSEERASRARLLANQQLVNAGYWWEAQALHSEALKAIQPESLSLDRLNAELQILRVEGELLSHELSLALGQGALASPPAKPSPSEGSSERDRWLSKSRSQLGQDLWVLEQLGWKRGGYFVEFGATDGVLLSNSWLLEKHFGWEGICAEPNPKLFERLQQNRSCTLSPACVYRSSGERMRFVLADAYGGLAELGTEDQHGAKREAYAAAGEVMEVTTTSLMDLLAQHGAPPLIDYLSIDTEGSELAILEGLDWERYRFRCITVEHNFTAQRQGLQTLLEARGYQRQEAQWDDWYVLMDE
ncbi:FkbM family methyltransferase [Synechococcus sp. MW101C3]|uniref:FkbM family methyltransferase n=1 Tax=Synechococcus sp. MW101C3 TaxID=210768 RepID=UPI000B9819D5|nr:FkbM family methyltransferase [Synechococcus sp. MW101C3]